MSLPGLSIRRPVLAWMATLALFIFGGMALKSLGISLLPDVDNPFVSVSVEFSGASPELIETDVTEVIESSLTSVEGVKNITSTSSYGQSRVTLEFDISKNINVAIQEVQTALQRAQRQLPEGIDAPVITKSNPEDQAILQIALSGPVELRQLIIFARNVLKDRFTSIEGVADVQLGGYVDPAIRIWLDPKKLASYELTFDDVLTSIKNEHHEIPVGRIERSKDEVELRIIGEAETVDELRNLPISSRSGHANYRKLLLGQMARIEPALEDVRRFARANGVQAIGLGIKKQRGVNAVELADRVSEAMKSISVPKGWKLELNFDRTEPIRKSVHELSFTLVLSIALTSIVCWLFLGSFASTFNILLAIPTSLLGTFIIMRFLGYTLNTFTMLALILGVGIIVDDAIMVLENIYRHRKTMPPREAALAGAEQVQLPALATSMAIIAIFLPVIYVSGVIGSYLTQFGIVISIAVAWSTFEALSFTPMRLAFLKKEKPVRGLPAYVDRGISHASEVYGRFVRRSLQHPFVVISVVLAIFGVSVLIARGVPKEMVPAEDTGRMLLRTELPIGISLDESSRRMAQLEELLKNDPNVARIFAVVGGFGGSSVNTGMAFITLKEEKNRDLKTDGEVTAELRKKFKTLGHDFKVRVQPMGASFGRRRSFPIDLNLTADSWDTLVKGSKILGDALDKDPAFADVDSSFEEGAPGYAIVPNRKAALERGVSVADVSESLQFLFNGIDAGKFNDSGRRVNIIVKADPKTAPQQVEDLKDVWVRNAYGELVSMSSLVTFRKESAPVSITRDNRQRNISVYANLAPGIVQEAGLLRANEIATKVLPPEVHLLKSGAGADFNKTFGELTIALCLGVLVAYMILASQFNSYIHPVTILLALPFSVTGALLTFKLTGATLNLYSMIGLLLLMGIVKKNSILLVEFANQRREAGLPVKEAMIDACRTRFRPIIMTSFATIAAAIPPAFRIGSDTVSSASMAQGICGGVLCSTFLTLVVVPVAYVVLSRFEKHHHSVAHEQEPAHEQHVEPPQAHIN